MNVSFVSLGCDKNRVNTEQMMALCLQAGITVQEDCPGIIHFIHSHGSGCPTNDPGYLAMGEEVPGPPGTHTEITHCDPGYRGGDKIPLQVAGIFHLRDHGRSKRTCVVCADILYT